MLQKVIEINELSTGASLLKKYISLYPTMIDEVLKLLETNTLVLKAQNHTKATFFGKRTPDDGLINWNWHKERIKNWIRAQSNPYPGAFAFYEDQKIIIDEIAFSDAGFSDLDVNGKIIQIKPALIVKTPNGCIEVVKMRSVEQIDFKIGNIFS